jgi:8-oxo-dGTP pyrophosphatase MutT (NUDIX family)
MVDEPGPAGPILTSDFEAAFRYANQLHARERRKGTTIPYVAHLASVAALVLEHGGDEEQAIAGLLHDAVENQGGRETLEEIRRRFGDRVAAIVEACTDSDTVPKPPRTERKAKYLAHLREAPADAMLVSAADKLHNARAILADYRRHGEELWSRFNAGRDDQLWYYRSLVDIFRDRGVPLAGELGRVVAELHRLVGGPNGTGVAWRRHEEAGGVLIHDGQVLVRRTPTGHYLFPKGHVEPGETLQQAAEREVEEETGIRGSAGRHVGFIAYTLADSCYEVHLFAMKKAGETESWAAHHDVDAFFLSTEEARRRLSFEDYRWALRRALEQPGR